MANRIPFRFSKGALRLYQKLWNSLSEDLEFRRRRDELVSDPLAQDEVAIIKGRSPLLEPIQSFDIELRRRVTLTHPNFDENQFREFIFYVWNYDSPHTELIGID